MSVENTPPSELLVNRKQIGFLKEGITRKGVEAFARVPEINAILTDALQHDLDEVSIPSSLASVARGLAMLVIESELEHEKGLMTSGRMHELDMRTSSEFGLYSKLRVLESVILFQATSEAVTNPNSPDS